MLILAQFVNKKSGLMPALDHSEPSFLLGINSVVVDATLGLIWIGIAEQFQGIGVVFIFWMVILVFLKGMDFVGEMAHLGVVALGFGVLDLRLILMNVLVDGFHRVLACAGLYHCHNISTLIGCAMGGGLTWFPLQHHCQGFSPLAPS